MKTLLLLGVLTLSLNLLATEPLSNPTLEKLPGVTHETFHSNAMNADIGYLVYLPPDYDKDEKHYSVLYYLHGGGDHESSHLVSSRLLDEQIRAGKIQPMIHVHAFGGRKGFYTDAPDGSLMSESMIIKELIPHIEKKYRAIASREGRGIHGWSMGGYGALKFAFKYPEMFSVVVAVSGGYLDGIGLKGSKIIDTMFGGDSEKFQHEAPAAWLRTNLEKIKDKQAIMLVVGTRDGLIENNKKMHALLDELKVEHRFEIIAEGQHNPRTLYPQSAELIFPFIAKHLAQPR